MSIANTVATAAQLARCRDRSALLLSTISNDSNSDGDSDVLDAVFFAVQRLTQAAGLLLELPQSTTACANVLLARYWVHEPGFEVGVAGAGAGAGVGAHDYCHVSAAAVFLAAKMGPLPRPSRHIFAVYSYLSDARPGNTPNSITTSISSTSDADYAAFHTHVLECERRLLTALAFDTSVALPHPLAITFLQSLNFLGQPPAASSPSPLSARMIAYLNTALLSPQLLYVTHQPYELAVAALYSAACDLGMQALLPSSPWWEVFDVDRETLGFLAVALRSVAAWAAATTLPPLGVTKAWLVRG